MQALTEEYIAAMRTVQPHGPYCLGGLCDGAHIGEQIVLRLEAQGEEVGLFAIFDTWVMQHSQIRWLWKVDYYRQRLRQTKWLNLSERLASYKRVAENKVAILRGRKLRGKDWQEALLARELYSRAVPSSSGSVQAAETTVLLHQRSGDGVGPKI